MFKGSKGSGRERTGGFPDDWEVSLVWAASC